ncbi:MAG: Hpt domain-containing protein [Nitrospinae bacterium]|nr:Hpt domain-containing protein [Nitrospinota bacterium]
MVEWDNDMDDLIKEFLDEAGEHVEGMNKNLLTLEGSIGKSVDKDVINTFFRSAHSLKGVSGMLGFMVVSKLTHKMENVLDKLRSGEWGITTVIVDNLFKGLDKLEVLLKGIREEGKEVIDISDYVSQIEGMLGQKEADKKDGSLPVGTGSQTVHLNISKELLSNLEKEEEKKILEKLKAGDGNVYEITMRLNRDCFERGISPIDFYKDVESLGQVISVVPLNLKPLPMDISLIKEYDIEIVILLSTNYNPDYIMSFLGSSELKINTIREIAKDKEFQPFDKTKYLQTFIDTMEDDIGKLSHEILKLENITKNSTEVLGGDLQSSINEIFRLHHKIKGSSAAMGYKPMSEVAHDSETILSRLRDKELSINGDVIDSLLKVADFFHNSIEKIKVNKDSLIDIADIKRKIVRFVKDDRKKGVEIAADMRKPIQLEVSEYNMSIIREAIEKGHKLFKINVFLKENTPLSFERVFLMKNNLDEIGSVIRCEPDPNVYKQDNNGNISQFAALISTDKDDNVIRKVVDIDMVESINIEPFSIDESKKAEGQGIAALQSSDNSGVVLQGKETVVSDRRDTEGTGRRLSEVSQVSPGAQSIRVDISRLDNLMNLTGELVISKARMGQFGVNFKDIFDHQKIFSLLDNINSNLSRSSLELQKYKKSASGDLFSETAKGVSDLSDKLSHDIAGLEMEIRNLYRKRTILLDFMEEINSLGRIAIGIQNGVMKSRMVAVGQLFHRFERIVRDLAKDRGKEIRLEISGEETELDKKVIDELGDPFTHMVRNSIDHGIESSEEREKSGKNKVAVLKFNASRVGNYICVEVSDDGKGIDVDRIKQKVIEKGMADPDKVSKFTEAELINFIFLPGFSTASKITDISGRGVGLDVVRQKIDGLGGQVDIVTEKGKGTKFVIKLPLTLAIVSALLARINTEIYSIPLDSVKEIVRFKKNEIHKLDLNDTIKLRGKVLTIVPLTDLLQMNNGFKYESDIITAVIVGLEDKQIGIVVDTLLGEQDIVIKSIGDYFSNVVGISGASILGNGEISLILDIPLLMKRTET